MTRNRPIAFLPAALLAAAAAVVCVACSPTGGYCQAQADCDDFGAGLGFGLDAVGESDDSVNVCIADNDGLISTLRANEESDCQQEADAYLEYMACVANEYAKDPNDACDPLKLDNSSPCHDEQRNFFDAQQDAGDSCSANER